MSKAQLSEYADHKVQRYCKDNIDTERTITIPYVIRLLFVVLFIFFNISLTYTFS